MTVNKICFCLVGFFLHSYFAFSQADTVWLYFEPTDEFSIRDYDENTNDILSLKFPNYDWRTYSYSDSLKDFRFYYINNPIDTVYKPFDYIQISDDELSSKNWVVSKWLKKKSFIDVIELFDTKDRVIMLYDSTQNTEGRQFAVRVYFIFIAEE